MQLEAKTFSEKILSDTLNLMKRKIIYKERNTRRPNFKIKLHKNLICKFSLDVK